MAKKIDHFKGGNDKQRDHLNKTVDQVNKNATDIEKMKKKNERGMERFVIIRNSFFYYAEIPAVIGDRIGLEPPA